MAVHPSFIDANQGDFSNFAMKAIQDQHGALGDN